MEFAEIDPMLINPSSVPESITSMKCASIDNRYGSLHLVLDEVCGTPVLHCEGRLVAGTETAALSAVVQSHFRSDIVLDLSGISAIDAGGLGTLVALYKWATMHDSRLILSNASERVCKLMDRTRLSWLLDIYYLPLSSFPLAEIERRTA
jgi:anti-anti-sigma factor